LAKLEEMYAPVAFSTPCHVTSPWWVLVGQSARRVRPGAYLHDAILSIVGVSICSRPTPNPTVVITSFQTTKNNCALPTCALLCKAAALQAAAYSHSAPGASNCPARASVTTRIHSSIPSAEGKNGSAALYPLLLFPVGPT
jgi:hypothetical protein